MIYAGIRPPVFLCQKKGWHNMYFIKKLAGAQPNNGQIAPFWLGQAGFLIKNSAGEILAVDPYFQTWSKGSMVSKD